jgi:large subunit ribosomal protein L17
MRRSKLSMMTAHRNAMLRNMVRNLLKFQRVTTTTAKAKETRRLAERLIALSKTDTVAARRAAYSVLNERDLVAKLFKEIAPLFKNRTSGFTRIVPLGFRRGDGASIAILELTEKKITEKLPKKKKAKEKAGETVQGAEDVGREAREEAKKPKEHHKKEAKKEEPTLEEEKRTEKAKSEDKKIADRKGFMKNIRGLFGRKREM